MISVIIPTWNAEAHLTRALAPLVAGVARGVIKEAVVVDGGSTDATLEIADEAGCIIVKSQLGRARQLIAGAGAARAPWLLFLHPDTMLTPGWEDEVERFIARPAAQSRAAAFTFDLDDDSPEARGIVRWTRFRSGLLKLPYGDQGLLISRRLYDIVGGYHMMDLMEDIDLVRRIGRRRLVLLKTPAITSAHKYRRDGFKRRGWRNLVLLSRYLMGADPSQLALDYD